MLIRMSLETLSILLSICCLDSVTDPQFRVKPAGVSDIMWAEAMGKLEGLSSTDRERLWPELVQGFKDLSLRLKIIVVSLKHKDNFICNMFCMEMLFWTAYRVALY